MLYTRARHKGLDHVTIHETRDRQRGGGRERERERRDRERREYVTELVSLLWYRANPLREFMEANSANRVTGNTIFNIVLMHS